MHVIVWRDDPINIPAHLAPVEPLHCNALAPLAVSPRPDDLERAVVVVAGWGWCAVSNGGWLLDHCSWGVLIHNGILSRMTAKRAKRPTLNARERQLWREVSKQWESITPLAEAELRKWVAATYEWEVSRENLTKPECNRYKTVQEMSMLATQAGAALSRVNKYQRNEQRTAKKQNPLEIYQAMV